MDTDGHQLPAGRVGYLEFGDLVLDPDRRTVFRGDTPVSLGKLTFNLLLLLARSAPGVVSQREVARTLWKGRPVTADTVRQRVKLLRKALGDDPENPRYLRVVRGQGYSLIPAVSVRHAEIRRPAPRRLTAGVIAASVAVAIALVYLAVRNDQNPAPAIEASINSVAVLPFENLTDDPDDEAFVDGFHNDLLTRLTKFGNLDVISRTSVLQYRGRAENLRLIGEALGAAAILEGSIQRAGEHLRINAQLVDASNDHHLWAEYYDRELTAENIFLIQSEIANAVAVALHSQLSGDTAAFLTSTPTGNMRAWNFYQLGNTLVQELNNMRAHDRAADAYQEAVNEDPDFALAWAALARAHSAVYFFRDRTDERRRLARQAIDRSLSLQPNLPEAHLALGYYHYHCEQDYAAADAEFAIAERGMPGNPEIFLARARIYVRRGDVDAAISNLERVVRLDPLNLSHRIDLGAFFTSARNYDRAASEYSRAIELAPEHPAPYIRLAMIPLLENGDVAAMLAAMHESPVRLFAGPLLWRAHIYNRDFDAALALISDWEFEAVDTQQMYRPVPWFFATTYRLAGDDAESAIHYADAAAAIEARLAQGGYDQRVRITQADILVQTGHADEAVALVDEVLQADDDASMRALMLQYSVNVLVGAGRYELALDRLEEYLSGPGMWTIEGLLPDPRLDPLRGNPRFERIVSRFGRAH